MLRKILRVLMFGFDILMLGFAGIVSMTSAFPVNDYPDNDCQKRNVGSFAIIGLSFVVSRFIIVYFDGQYFQRKNFNKQAIVFGLGIVQIVLQITLMVIFGSRATRC